MFPDQQEVFSHYRLLEKQTLAQYSGDLELVFIELPKFTKGLAELATISDKWVYFVKNAGSLDYVPDNLKLDPCIVDAFSIANQAGLTEEELEAQERRFDFLRIQRALHDEKRATEERLQAAEERAAEAERALLESQTNIARNLLDILDDTTIAQKTGLAVEEVSALRQSPV